MSNGLRQEDPLRLLLERDAVVTTINRLFRSVDAMDWDGARVCFAPRVVLDTVSLSGGEPEDTTPEAIVEGWRESFGHLEAIHHQAGNYEVEVHGNEASASCNGIAFHYLPNESGQDTHRFVGTYDVGLQKVRGSWRIDSLRYNLKFIDGNLDPEGVEEGD
jgi:hypothetical protein